MKKVIFALGILLALFVISAIALPLIFKEDIKAAIDQQISNNVKAKVFYDQSSIDVSLIKRFPNLSVSMGNIGIVGVSPFEGDTLAAMKQFTVAVNLFSLFGDQITISGIYLDEPKFKILVLEDGSANYDISIPSEEAESTSASSSKISIDNWEINNGTFYYEDRTLPFSTSLSAINHSGSGDFESNIFDMKSSTKALLNDMSYDGVSYLSNKNVTADMTMGIDLDQFKFTFKENEMLINDFAVAFDGFLAMPADDIEMDLTFETKKNTFNSLLSLVPGMYSADFDKLKTSGNVDFSGFVKGIYNDNMMPAFNISLNVEEGMFQYPDLPTPVNNINAKIIVDNKDGNIDNTVIDIQKLHLDAGSNPVDVQMKINNLVDYDMVAKINAKLNLAEIASIFPVAGLAMKGGLAVNLDAKGKYDSISGTFPTMALAMNLKDGNIKYESYPIPMEDMQVDLKVNNATGKMADTKVLLQKLTMLVDGERVEGKATIENFEDYTWDMALNGTIDLENISKIFPIENTTMKGKIKADLTSKGKMSDVEAERYGNLTNAGTMEISQLEYTSADLPSGMQIPQARFSVDNRTINILKFDSKIGKSDISMVGSISNYMAFMLQDNELINGNLSITSNLLDLNELMTGESTTTTEESTLEVIEVPEYLNFQVDATMAKILYEKYEVKNLNGQLIVQDGTVRMNDVNFNMLEGDFTLEGTYSTKGVKQPLFNFDFGVKELSIAESYKSLDLVKALAPMAQHIQGKFSTDFKLAGQLGRDMMPIYTSLSGAGLIAIAQAAVQDVKLLKVISTFTDLRAKSDGGGFALKDLLMAAEIKEGKFVLSPFELDLGGRKAVVSGSNGLDGSIDYVFSTQVPAGAAGQAVGSALSSFLGSSEAFSGDIDLNLKITGTYDDPKISIASAKPAGAEGGIKALVKESVQEQVDQKKAEIEEKAKEELDRQKDVLENKAKEELKGIIKNDSTIAKPLEGAKDVLKGLLKKKKDGGGL
jgi:hypothetical protein